MLKWEHYTLEAVGKDYTISEITEMDFKEVEDYAPKMTGIELNQVLHAGDVAYVKMWAKPTTGARTNVVYSVSSLIVTFHKLHGRCLRLKC